MEPVVATGGNPWQMEPRERLKQAKFVCRGCDQLPESMVRRRSLSAQAGTVRAAYPRSSALWRRLRRAANGQQTSESASLNHAKLNHEDPAKPHE
jgi:hypothetical protein